LVPSNSGGRCVECPSLNWDDENSVAIFVVDLYPP